MWNIWKEEVCKILSRRLIWIGLFVLAAFLTLRLVTEQGHYSASIDGNTYFGQEALEKDKQLAAQYAGILTEETVHRIYENFGFAYYNEQNILTGNFCSRFITEKMTDFNQTEGNDPDSIHFLEGDSWKQYTEPYLDGSVWFDYAYGWNDLKEMVPFMAAGLFVLFIIGLSPVFSEEYSCKTADILLTTSRGKKSCIFLKMLAALSVTGVLYVLSAGYLWILYLATFGTQGLDASSVLIGIPAGGFTPDSIGGFFIYAFVLGLASLVLLCCMTLAVSALNRNAFAAVILSTVLFFAPFAWTRIGIATLAPLLGLHLTKAVTYLACSMPFLLSMQWGFAFTRSQELIQFAIALAAGCICTGLAYYRFRNYQGL